MPTWINPQETLAGCVFTYVRYSSGVETAVYKAVANVNKRNAQAMYTLSSVGHFERGIEISPIVLRFNALLMYFVISNSWLNHRQ